MGNGQQFRNAFNFDIAAFLYTLDHSCRYIHEKKRSKVKKEYMLFDRSAINALKLHYEHI